MESSYKIRIREAYIRWVGPVLMALVLPFFMGKKCSFPLMFLISLLFSITIWWGNRAIWFYFQKRLAGFHQLTNRLWKTYLGVIIYTFIAGSFIELFIMTAFNQQDESWNEWFEGVRISYYLTLVIMLLYEIAYFIEQWKGSILEAEKLKTQHVRSQFEVLKNQVSPHFLFNSLNTLVSIIPENPDLAVKFTEQLSKVYRYILQNKNKELVDLKTELDFIESYIFLLKIRFGQNIQVNFQVEEAYFKDYVAPLTLQMLVENAIKHNIVSKAKPLYIEIYVANGRSIIVKNNLQKKNQAQPTTKIGLENIKKRYKYLTNQAVDIITSTNNFMVALPLIKHLEVAV